MISALRKSGRSITCIDGDSEADNRIDHQAVGGLAAEHLLDRGFKSLACLTSTGLIDRARERGFLQAVELSGLPAKSVARLCFAEQLRIRLGDWLSRLPSPAGVFAVNDRLGLAVADAALDAGISIPGQVALIAAGNRESLCVLCHPALSSVSIPYEQMGYEAAQLVVAGLDRPLVRRDVTSCQPSAVIVRNSSNTVAVHDPFVAEAIRHIYQYARSRIDISAIAKRLQISRRNLEQRFRAAVGRTLLQEIHRVRIDLAKEALIYSDDSMPQIAERCGFRSSVHLSVLFSRQTGTAPTQFRQRYRRRS
jgi:LacI family transcriptional regulator